MSGFRSENDKYSSVPDYAS